MKIYNLMYFQENTSEVYTQVYIPGTVGKEDDIIHDRTFSFLSEAKKAGNITAKVNSLVLKGKGQLRPLYLYPGWIFEMDEETYQSSIRSFFI